MNETTSRIIMTVASPVQSIDKNGFALPHEHIMFTLGVGPLLMALASKSDFWTRTAKTISVQAQQKLHMWPYARLHRPGRCRRAAALPIADFDQGSYIRLTRRDREARIELTLFYPYSLVQGLSTPRNRKGSSEHVRLGVLLHKSNFPLLFSLLIN